MTLIPSLTFTDYEWFPWSICNGCGMPAGNAYHSGHLVPSPFLGGLHVLWLLRPVFPTRSPIKWPTEVDLYRIERFPWSICDRCGMPAGSAYPSGHLVPSPILGLASAPIVETKFLELAMSLLDFSHRIPLGTFSILLLLFWLTSNFMIFLWNLRILSLLHSKYFFYHFLIIYTYALIKHFYYSSVISSLERYNITEMGTRLKYGDLMYDVIMDLFGIIFRIFCNQQNCMIIGINLIYNFHSSRLKHNFSKGKKLLHVFWNTLYLLVLCANQAVIK